MGTRARVCAAKVRFSDLTAAQAVASGHDWAVRPYRCDRCGHWHLTSRLRGKRRPRPESAKPA